MAPSPTTLRFAVGAFVIALMAFLLYAGVVSVEAGLPIIVAVAAGLGIYEMGARRKNGG